MAAQVDSVDPTPPPEQEPPASNESVEQNETTAPAAQNETTAPAAEGVALAAGMFEKLRVRSDIHTVNDKVFKVELADDRRNIEPVDSFQKMGLDEGILNSVQIEMEYSVPYLIQQLAVPLITQFPNEALLAQAQAGSGKTAAFVLGILQRLDLSVPVGSPQAIIVAPTHELVHQHVENIEKMAKHMKAPDGRTGIMVSSVLGMGPSRGGRGGGRGRRTKGEKIIAHVAVGTVGKVTGLLNDGLIKGKEVKILVFDEADSLLSRADEYNICQTLCTKRVPNAQPLFFSATFTDQLKERIRNDLLGRRRAMNSISLVTEHADQEGLIDDSTLFMSCVDCSVHSDGKFGILVEIYSFLDLSGATLIFVETKRTAAALAQRLFDMSYSPLVLTGDTPKEQRLPLFNEFRNGDNFNVCICTNVLAMGIDISKITMVINYDLPTTRNAAGDTVTHFEAFLQRGGRSTRGGSRGILINLVEGDMQRLLEIENHFWRSAEPFSKIQQVALDEDNNFDVEVLKRMISEFMNR